MFDNKKNKPIKLLIINVTYKFRGFKKIKPLNWFWYLGKTKLQAMRKIKIANNFFIYQINQLDCTALIFFLQALKCRRLTELQ